MNEDDKKGLELVKRFAAYKRDGFPGNQFFHTVGVYHNDSFWKQNCVAREHIVSHIWYNLTYRWGRSLFIDGMCVYPGALDRNKIPMWQNRLKDWKMPPHTLPYH